MYTNTLQTDMSKGNRGCIELGLYCLCKSRGSAMSEPRASTIYLPGGSSISIPGGCMISIQSDRTNLYQIFTSFTGVLVCIN